MRRDMHSPLPRKLKQLPLLVLPLAWACSGAPESGADRDSDQLPSSIRKEPAAATNQAASTTGSNESEIENEPRLAPEKNDSVTEGDDLEMGNSIEGSEEDGRKNTPLKLRVLSLNVYGYKTMPQSAPDYAEIIEANEIELVGLQEGVNDWQLTTPLPMDYSRSEALADALGECWEQRYQIFINTCAGLSFISNQRFDLTDGPNATRTGELAIVQKNQTNFAVIDVHWDHESSTTKLSNASETAAIVNEYSDKPIIVLGDFNTGCTASETESMLNQTSLELIVNGGIDCIFSSDAKGTGSTINASPSDHPGVVAELTL